MSTKSQSRSAGISFFTLLGLLFIALKLMGYIDWSWWLVLLPLYGPLALTLAVLAVVGIVLSILGVLAKW